MSNEFGDILDAIASGSSTTQYNIGFYNNLVSYVMSHDSAPSTKKGQRRFNTAAKLLAEVGFKIAGQIPEQQGSIESIFQMTAVRSKAFRDSLVEEAKKARKENNPAVNNFAMSQIIYAQGANKALEVLGKSEINGKLSSSSVFDEVNKVIDVADSHLAPQRSEGPVPEYLIADISEVNTKSVGGQMSERLPLTIGLEDGSQLKGFFTKDSVVDFDSEYTSTIDNAIQEANTDLSVNGDGSPSLAAEFLGKLKEKYSGREFADLVRTAVNANSYNHLGDFFFPNNYNKTERDAIFNALYKRIPDVAKYANALREDAGLRTALCNLTESLMEIRGKEVTMVNGAELQVGSNINRRNNALYEVSQLLGETELICKSVSMTCMKDGEPVKGTFMINATGYGVSNIPCVKDQGKQSDLIISGQAKRSISHMQITDFLCGNIDRHTGNMFYNVEYKNGDMVMTSIQGIDNDLSFGTISGEGAGTMSYMSNIDDIHYIDKKQATMISGLSPIKFEEKLRQNGLTEKEVAAGLKRLDLLKKKILTPPEKGGFTVLNSDAEFENLDLESLARGTDGRISTNIWSRILGVKQNYPPNRAMSLEEFNALKAPAPKTISALLNENAKLLLDSQLDIFNEVKAGLDKTNPEKASEEFQKVYDSVKDTIAFMNECRAKNELSDNDLNLISDNIQDSILAAQEYVLKKPRNPRTQNGKDRLHFAKNLIAVANNAKNKFRDEQTAAFNRRMKAEYAKPEAKANSIKKLAKDLEGNDNLTLKEVKECLDKISAFSAQYPDEKALQLAARETQQAIFDKYIKTEEIFNDLYEGEEAQKDAFFSVKDRAADLDMAPVTMKSSEIKAMIDPAADISAEFNIPIKLRNDYGTFMSKLNERLAADAISAQEWEKEVMPVANSLIASFDAACKQTPAMLANANVKKFYDVMGRLGAVSDSFMERECQAKDAYLNELIKDAEKNSNTVGQAVGKIAAIYNRVGLSIDSVEPNDMAEKLKFNAAQEKWLTGVKKSIEENSAQLNNDIDIRLLPSKAIVNMKQLRENYKQHADELGQYDQQLSDLKTQLQQAKDEVFKAGYENMLTEENVKDFPDDYAPKQQFAKIKPDLDNYTNLQDTVFSLQDIVDRKNANPDYKLSQRQKDRMVDFLVSVYPGGDPDELAQYRDSLNAQDADALYSEQEIGRKYEYKLQELNNLRKTRPEIPQYFANKAIYEKGYKPLIANLNAEITAMENKIADKESVMDNEVQQAIDDVKAAFPSELDAKTFINSNLDMNDADFNIAFKKAAEKLSPIHSNIALDTERNLLNKNNETLKLVDNQLQMIADYKSCLENKNPGSELDPQITFYNHVNERAKKSVEKGQGPKEMADKIKIGLSNLGKRLGNETFSNMLQGDMSPEKLNEIVKYSAGLVYDNKASDFDRKIAKEIKSYAVSAKGKLEKAIQANEKTLSRASKLPSKAENSKALLESKLAPNKTKSEKFFSENFVDKMDEIDEAVDSRAEYFTEQADKYNDAKLAKQLKNPKLTTKRNAIINTDPIAPREGNKKQEKLKREAEEKARKEQEVKKAHSRRRVKGK